MRSTQIRAEDGRSIEKVNISPFISNLPRGKSTVAFSTPDASGSTSQAANIMEALEVYSARGTRHTGTDDRFVVILQRYVN